MSKKLIGCGFVAFAICVAAGSAQAKLIRYEIDGKRYSYSTNNIQQTREARQRIEAANAAAAARARAEAERASNPLARIFGSRAQREAADAQTRLKQAVSPGAAPQDDADFEATSSLKRGRAETRRSARAVQARAERRRALREARLERRALREARVERRRKMASDRAQRRASLSVATNRGELRKEAPRSLEAQNRVEPAPKLPAIEKVHLGGDPPSKNTPAQSGPAESGGNSLMDFVNQVRRALP
jgi:hypothetical protein